MLGVMVREERIRGNGNFGKVGLDSAYGGWLREFWCLLLPS